MKYITLCCLSFLFLTLHAQTNCNTAALQELSKEAQKHTLIKSYDIVLNTNQKTSEQSFALQKGIKYGIELITNSKTSGDFELILTGTNGQPSMIVANPTIAAIPSAYAKGGVNFVEFTPAKTGVFQLKETLKSNKSACGIVRIYLLSSETEKQKTTTTTNSVLPFDLSTSDIKDLQKLIVSEIKKAPIKNKRAGIIEVGINLNEYGVVSSIQYTKSLGNEYEKIVERVVRNSVKFTATPKHAHAQKAVNTKLMFKIEVN